MSKRRNTIPERVAVLEESVRHINEELGDLKDILIGDEKNGVVARLVRIESQISLWPKVLSVLVGILTGIVAVSKLWPG